MKKKTLIITIIIALVIIGFFLWLYFISEVVFFSYQCKPMCSSCYKESFFKGYAVECRTLKGGPMSSVCEINEKCTVENFKCKYESNWNQLCLDCFSSCGNYSKSSSDFYLKCITGCRDNWRKEI
jgi:hypothetical protein